MNLFAILAFFWPRMTLKRFEKAYRDAVSKHGEQNALIIATSMKSTCVALGLRYVADVQADKQQAKALAKIDKLSVKSTKAAEELARRQAELEQQLEEQRVRTGTKLSEAAAKQREHQDRIAAINNIKHIL